MKLFRKVMALVIVFLIFSSYGYSFSNNGQSLTVKYDTFSLLDGARLVEQDGIKILYINGSYYEMGYQHGFLLKDEVNENFRAFMDYSRNVTSYNVLLDMWSETEPYIPSCYIKEMHGLADGADVSFEKVAALYMFVLFIDMKCFTYAAWLNATADGKLYHIRSLDFPLVIRDPVTGRYIQENSVLIIRNPKNGFKSIVPSIAGSINFYQGINENQVSVGVQVCWSYDQTLKGTPVKFKILRILDTAENAEEAIDKN